MSRTYTEDEEKTHLHRFKSTVEPQDAIGKANLIDSMG